MKAKVVDGFNGREIASFKNARKAFKLAEKLNTHRFLSGLLPVYEVVSEDAVWKWNNRKNKDEWTGPRPCRFCCQFDCICPAGE